MSGQPLPSGMPVTTTGSTASFRSSRGRVVKPKLWAEDGEADNPVAGFRASVQAEQTRQRNKRRASSAGLDGHDSSRSTHDDVQVEDDSDGERRSSRRTGSTGLLKRASVPVRDGTGRFIGVRARTVAEKMQKLLTGSGGVFKSAAVQILRAEMRLLSTGEIARQAMRQGLLQCQGKTPEATMASALYTDVKRREAASMFIRPHEGLFGLREWAEAGLSFDADGSQVWNTGGSTQWPSKRARTAAAIKDNTSDAAAAPQPHSAGSVAAFNAFSNAGTRSVRSRQRRGSGRPRSGGADAWKAAAAATPVSRANSQEQEEIQRSGDTDESNIMLLISAAEELHGSAPKPEHAGSMEVEMPAPAAAATDTKPTPTKPSRPAAEVATVRVAPQPPSHEPLPAPAARQPAMLVAPAAAGSAAVQLPAGQPTGSSQALHGASDVEYPAEVQQLAQEAAALEARLGATHPEVGRAWLFLARAQQAVGAAAVADVSLARAHCILWAGTPGLPAAPQFPAPGPPAAATAQTRLQTVTTGMPWRKAAARTAAAACPQAAAASALEGGSGSLASTLPQQVSIVTAEARPPFDEQQQPCDGTTAAAAVKQDSDAGSIHVPALAAATPAASAAASDAEQPQLQSAATAELELAFLQELAAGPDKSPGSPERTHVQQPVQTKSAAASAGVGQAARQMAAAQPAASTFRPAPPANDSTSFSAPRFGAGRMDCISMLPAAHRMSTAVS